MSMLSEVRFAALLDSPAAALNCPIAELKSTQCPADRGNLFIERVDQFVHFGDAGPIQPYGQVEFLAGLFDPLGRLADRIGDLAHHDHADTNCEKKVVKWSVDTIRT